MLPDAMGTWFVETRLGRWPREAAIETHVSPSSKEGKSRQAFLYMHILCFLMYICLDFLSEIFSSFAVKWYFFSPFCNLSETWCTLTARSVLFKCLSIISALS